MRRKNINMSILTAIGYKKPSKYGAQKQEIDGFKLDSKAEGIRYVELKVLQQAKEIKELCVHPKYRIQINGVSICVYEADFEYKDKSGVVHIEDVKGVKTPAYQLKKKLLKAVHGLEIEEVKPSRSFRGVDIDKVHAKRRMRAWKT